MVVRRGENMELSVHRGFRHVLSVGGSESVSVGPGCAEREKMELGKCARIGWVCENVRPLVHTMLYGRAATCCHAPSREPLWRLAMRPALFSIRQHGHAVSHVTGLTAHARVRIRTHARDKSATRDHSKSRSLERGNERRPIQYPHMIVACESEPPTWPLAAASRRPSPCSSAHRGRGRQLPRLPTCAPSLLAPLAIREHSVRACDRPCCRARRARIAHPQR